MLFVPESSDRAGRSLDLPGQVTAVIGLVALTYAFIEANTYGWTSARIVSCFVVSGLALGLFLLVELRGRTPLLQLKFFRNGTFSGANLVGVIMSFAFFGVIFFLSLFMQEVQGYSPTQAGALQLPATLGIMAAAIVSGRIVGRIGARLPITIGLLMTGTALLCLTSLEPNSGYASFWYWLLLMGVGSGLIMSPMTTAIMGTVPAPRAGMASATSNTMRQVGSVFGIAVLGNLVTRPITDHTLAALNPLRLPPALVGGIMAAVKEGRDLASGKLPPGVDGAALMHTVKSASAAGFTSGMHAALWVSGIMLIAGAPIALLTIRGTAPHHVAALRPRVGAPPLRAESMPAAGGWTRHPVLAFAADLQQTFGNGGAKKFLPSLTSRIARSRFSPNSVSPENPSRPLRPCAPHIRHRCARTAPAPWQMDCRAGSAGWLPSH